jgi:flagellin
MVSVSSSTTSGVYSNQINRNEKNAVKSLNQIGSGKSINKASDNAAGLAIATQLSSDVTTLRQSSSNLLQGSSVLQTADGALEQSGNILNRMKELSTQASSGSLDSNSRSAINDEYQNLKGELDKISSNTSFNGQKLVDGTYNNNFQAGTSATDTISANLSGVDSSATGLGLTAGAGASATALSTPASAQAASNELDSAISKLSSYRSEVGAIQSSFSTRSDVVDSEIENTLSAESAIMDADIGKSMSEFTNSKLMSEVSLASAAQGNKMSTSMLRLVR